MGYPPYSYYMVQSGQQSGQSQQVMTMSNPSPRPTMIITGAAVPARPTSKLGNVLLLWSFLLTFSPLRIWM